MPNYDTLEPATSFVQPTVGSPFGTAIPLILGSATVAGTNIFVTNTVVQLEGAQSQNETVTIDFVVVFGKPDPNMSNLSITQMYDDGQLFYDTTSGVLVVQDGYNVRLYTGTQTQTPDPIFEATLGSLAPALRGLVYAVFTGYTLRSGSAGVLPQILASIVQTNADVLTLTTMPGGIYGPSYAYFEVDHGTNQIIYYGQYGIDLFDYSAYVYLYSLPLICADGTPSPVITSIGATQGMTMSNDGDHYYALIGLSPASGGTYAYAYINKRTNIVEAYTTANVDPYDTVCMTAVKGVGQWQEYLVVGQRGALATFGLKNGTLSYITNIASSGGWQLLSEAYAPAYITTWADFTYLNLPGLDNTLAYQTIGLDYGAQQFQQTHVPDQGGAYTVIPTTPSGTQFQGSYDILQSDYADLVMSPENPQDVCPLVDNTKFAIFYAVQNNSQLWRFILTDNQPAVVAMRPSNIAPNRTYVTWLGKFVQGEGRVTDFYYGQASYTANTDESPPPSLPPGYTQVQLAGPGGTYVQFSDLYNFVPPAYGPYNVNQPYSRSWNTPITGALHGPEMTPLTYSVSGDTATLMATLTPPAPGAVPKVLYTGPAEDPFVSVLFSNGTLRRFDTFWNRRDTADYTLYTDPTTGFVSQVANPGPFQSNYMVMNIVLSPVNKFFMEPIVEPMQSQIINYFQAYPDVTILPYIEGTQAAQMGNTRTGYRYDKSTFSWTYGLNPGDIVVADMYEAATHTYGGSVTFQNDAGVTLPNPITENSYIEDQDGTIICEPPAIVFINGGVTIGDVGLDKIIGSMLTCAGYSASQMNFSGLSQISVKGAVLNETVLVTDLLDALSQTFAFSYFDTNGKINCVKGGRNSQLTFAGTVYESDLIPLNDDPDDGTVLQYERALPSDVPSEITLEYLDQDYLCSVGTQVAQRTIFPYQTISGAQPQDLSVPIVMDADNAAYWANNALYNLWASITTVSFRLGFSAIVYDPGDDIQLIRNDGSVLNLCLTQTTLNGDKSVSIKGATISLYNGFSAPSGVDPNFNAAATLARGIASTLYCPDNVLVNPSDETDASSEFAYRWASNQAAGLYLPNADDSSYSLFSQSPTPAASGQLLTVLPALPKGWCPNIDLSASFTYLPSQNGILPRVGTSDSDVVSGNYVCFVGQPGRWEMIFYNSLSTNPTTKQITVSGLVRGRRGTDAVAGMHQPGDLVFFPPFSFASFDMGYTKIGETQLIQTRGSVGVQSPVLSGIAYVGLPLRPWAPCQLAATQSGADIVISWTRRTRAADALHDGDASIGQDEPTIAFIVYIATNGSTARVLQVSGDGGSVTYTAAMIAADGYTSQPTTLTYAVQEVSQYLPALQGWPATRTNDPVLGA